MSITSPLWPKAERTVLKTCNCSARRATRPKQTTACLSFTFGEQEAIISGFDNGTMQGGVYFQAKQFGSILRGFGPPVPQAGVLGDVYLDVQTWQLFTKRSNDAGGDVDPWGHYLFIVPLPYRTQLKWFSAYAPTDDVGVAGDYCLLWGGWTNYGLQP